MLTLFSPWYASCVPLPFVCSQDYFDVIKQPMDLGTVKRRLEGGYYKAPEQFAEHVRLTFTNAMTYNPSQHVVHEAARRLLEMFAVEFQKVEDAIDRQVQSRRDGRTRGLSGQEDLSNVCPLCEGGKFFFEPPVYYCNGRCQVCALSRRRARTRRRADWWPRTQSRIRRSSHFFTESENKYHWCTACHAELPDEVDMGDVVLLKSQLLKKKNDELMEEPWVQCDRCARWLHQICALFNTRVSERGGFVCPNCVLDMTAPYPDSFALSRDPMCAAKLEQTKLTNVLEGRIRNRINREIMNRAQQLQKDVTELRRTEEPQRLTLRLVSNTVKKCFAKRNFATRYAGREDFHFEFPYKSKALLLFQVGDAALVVRSRVCSLALSPPLALLLPSPAPPPLPMRRRSLTAWTCCCLRCTCKSMTTSARRPTSAACTSPTSTLSNTSSPLGSAPPCSTRS